MGILMGVLYLLYFWINMVIARINTDTVHSRQRAGIKKQIEHPLWAFVYAAIISPMWFVFHSWWFIGAITLLHLSVFPVVYNILMELPAFNLSKTSKAITDILMVKAGLKSTEKVNLAAFFISLGLLIKAIVSIIHV